jgi:hypothetical protein
MSNPIRLNDFSFTLTVIAIFLYGLPGPIVFCLGQIVFVLGSFLEWSIWGLQAWLITHLVVLVTCEIQLGLIHVCSPGLFQGHLVLHVSQ